MRRFLLVLIVTLAALGLSITALVVASSKPSTPSKGVHLAAPVHPCDPQHFYMQCGANAPGQILSFSASPGSKFGVDFAWGGPSGSVAKGRGASFACSYLSGTSKDWSYSLIHSYVNVGLGACFVWETSATRSLSGYSAGVSDAYNAQREAARLGYPHAHIFFASDFDSSNYGCAFCNYYRGARDESRKLGNSAGGYGGYHTVATLCSLGISPNWQTLAWSYGQWTSSSCSPLRQTSINDSWFGSSVDFDLAVGTNYGQVNYAKPKPSPPAGPRCFTHLETRGACTAAKNRIAYDKKTEGKFANGLHRDHCRYPYRRHNCVKQAHWWNHYYIDAWRTRRSN